MFDNKKLAQIIKLVEAEILLPQEARVLLNINELVKLKVEHLTDGLNQ